MAFRHLDRGELSEARNVCEGLLGQNAEDSDVLHVLGLIEAREGRLDVAARQLSRAARLRPELPYFHYRLANVYQDRGKLDRAIAHYRKAIRIKKDFAEAHNDLGTAYYAKSWLEEAIASYRRAIEHDPNHAIAHENMGAALRKKGDLRGARRHLTIELRLRLRAGLLEAGRRVARLVGIKSAPGSLARDALRFAGEGNLPLAAAIARGALAANDSAPWALGVLAIARHEEGAAGEALDLARRALRAPGRKDAGLLNALGQLLARLGHPGEAIEAVTAALAAEASNFVARKGLGLLLLETGNRGKARQQLQQALEINGESLEVRVALAQIARKSQQFKEAEALLDFVLSREPEDVSALLGLADLWRAQDRFDEAQAMYRRLSQNGLESVRDWYQVGVGLRECGQYNEAVKCFEAALEIKPDSLLALTHRGILLTDMGRPHEAVKDLRKALEINERYVDARAHLGRALHYAEQHEEARQCYEDALQLRPGWHLPLSLLGTSHETHGDYSKAAEYYREALQRSPDDVPTLVNLAHTELVRGDLQRGLELYEARLTLDEYRPAHKQLSIPRWDGAPIRSKRIAVYGEQGLGDEINFASCLPNVLSLEPERVYLTCNAKLGALFKRSLPEVEICACELQQNTAWLRGLSPPPDLQVAAGSLPRFFHRTIDDLGARTPYLKADEGKVRRWREKLSTLGPGAKIGLSWKGGIIRTGELRRTLSLERLLPILRVPGAQFVSLQYTECKADLGELRSRHGIEVHHWQEAIDDYDETAALVCGLDLIISVCTAVVHLAGALGRPVWVMAPVGPHWRYAMPGDRMPWYPSVRVFRQERLGEWDGVIARIEHSLTDRLRAQAVRRDAGGRNSTSP